MNFLQRMPQSAKVALVAALLVGAVATWYLAFFRPAQLAELGGKRPDTRWPPHLPARQPPGPPWPIVACAAGSSWPTSGLAGLTCWRCGLGLPSKGKHRHGQAGVDGGVDGLGHGLGRPATPKSEVQTRDGGETL